MFFNNLIAIYSHETQVESNKEQQVLQVGRKEQNSTLRRGGRGKTQRIASRLKKKVLEEKQKKR